MRNLVVVDHRRQVVPAVPSDALLCVDPLSLAPHMATTEGVRSLDQASSSWPAVTWGQHGIKTVRVVSAECVAAAAALCVVTAEGQVVTVAEDGQVEVAGEVAEGIAAAQWSPDQELLALVTPSGLVLLMTASLDPIAETRLGDGAGQEMVALGWGKKETQFHGSEGKAAARVPKSATRPVPDWDDRLPRVTWRGDGELFAVSHLPVASRVRKIVILNRECVIQSVSEDLDALESPLAWKPSGSIIASTQTTATKHEVAFVEKNGLKHGGFVLPFAPGCMEVVELSWSPDSSVLAVWVRPLVDEEVEEVVQLWTCGNYHWYLKREVRFGGRGLGRGGGGGGGQGEEDAKEGKKEDRREEENKENIRGNKTKNKEKQEKQDDIKEKEEIEEKQHQNIISIKWTEEATPPLHTLHILTTTHHHRLTLLHTTHHSQGHSPQDTASVAVVDGQRVLVTPFRQTTIPPPMSAYEVEFPGTVNSVAFCLSDSSADVDVDDSGYLEGCEDVGVGCNSLCVQHGLDKITFLAAAASEDVVEGHGCSVRVTGAAGDGFRVSVRPLGVYGQCEVQWPASVAPRPASARELYHWAWPRKDLLVAVFASDGVCHLVFVEVQETAQAVAKDVVALEDFVVAMATSPTVAALQLASGSLVKLDLATHSLEPWVVDGTEVQLPATLQKLCLCPMEGVASLTPLGLTPRGRLYLGHRQVLANCTSVLLHTHHLLATTSAHTLLAVPLTPQALAGLEEASVGAGVRRVERGARLVCSVAHDTRVVMQMPRGNLEVVSPRPLALHALGRLVAARQYGAALALALRHRVDTNLLYDHQPAHFLAAADHFVRDVADPQRLDVFLAALTEADCTATTYAFHYPSRPAATAGAAAPGKVAAVCEAVRAAMVAVDEGRLLLPILTSLVRSGRMEDALARLGDMRRRAEAGQAFPVGPEEGLRHLLYLADTEELYRVALGTYDLSLALMVAQRSTRDPKEYLPQLNGLAALPEALRRFRIDATLRRFTTALRGVDDAAPHRDEALALVDARGLHALALQLLPAGSQVKAAVCERYGRRLLADNRPAEAAIMLGRAGLHQAALEAYRSAGNWQMSLVMAARLGMAKERVGELCRDLAGELRGQGRHTEAARLYEHHLADEEEAVACLAAAGEWQDALRLTHQYGRPDLLQTHVQPGARQQAAATLADTRDTAAAITRQAARLAAVRAARQRQHAASLALAAEDAPLDSDLYSDTSTVAGLDQSRRTASTTTASTAASSRSHRSSKSRRKLERKKYSTKEGSPQEDLGLVAALHEIYSSLGRRAEATSALCAALVILGHDTEAAELQHAFSDLLQLAEARKAEIWPAAAPQDQEFGPQMTTQGAVDQVMAGAGAGQAEGSWVALRMAQLEPHLRFPPPPVRDAWRLGLLAWQDKGD
ncbi:hypothetical protein O3P69_019574 [Scylla paramamosain]|uniref:Elongator complex protein 1 n=1 Tax=Scylla paramamosain TaxID=85552 RepID=A0AAW0SXI3_SCYPA